MGDNMGKVFRMLGLKEEANLMDSKLFMLKTFMAVAAAYLIGHNNALLSKDMISILFGMMLTLEPVAFTGLRNGIDQIKASVIGAASTAVIIYFFGINVFTIALSIAFTLYVCLKINWREVSPVAIFTAIYMTQYMQKDAAGNLSILLTFELRMAALITGVAIAVLLNFLFSLYSNRNMLYKRVAFLHKSALNNLEKTLKAIQEMNKEEFLHIKRDLPNTFNNIDWVYGLFQDIRKEYKYKSLYRISDDQLEALCSAALSIRNITHLNYDIIYCLSENDFECSIAEKDKLCEELSKIISIMSSRDILNGDMSLKFGKNADENNLSTNLSYKRILFDIKEISNNI
jgi:uncharacterized membrane protein YgaE (UPF0421/DUF939 family)